MINKSFDDNNNDYLYAKGLSLLIITFLNLFKILFRSNASKSFLMSSSAIVFGLKPNPYTSNVYGCGLTNEQLNQMLQCYGFSASKMPFKYLGIPISRKKLNY